MADKAILVVSFGTSYPETREKTIERIEKRIAAKYPEFDCYRAFTSKTIISKMQKNEGIVVDTPSEAMEKIASKGYSEVYIQPLHLINGYEYDDLEEAVLAFGSEFDVLGIGLPLLTIEEDYWKVIDAVTKTYADEISDPNNHVIFMGHGTEHATFSTYPALEYMFHHKGYKNVKMATVDGFPSLEMILDQLKAHPSKKVTLIPFMLVAGDHATNDMASDEEDSWKSILENEGFEVKCILKGLGEISDIQAIYEYHLQELIELDITEAHEHHDHHDHHAHHADHAHGEHDHEKHGQNGHCGSCQCGHKH